MKTPCVNTAAQNPRFCFERDFDNGRLNPGAMSSSTTTMTSALVGVALDLLGGVFVSCKQISEYLHMKSPCNYPRDL